MGRGAVPRGVARLCHSRARLRRARQRPSLLDLDRGVCPLAAVPGIPQAGY
jgi:hypothetical protein